MIKKSRMVVALAMTAALAVSGVAYGTAAENEPIVDGKVMPAKVKKSKFQPVALFLGVRNSDDWITGTQSNPARELISISNNVTINLNSKRATRCANVDAITPGTPTAQARQQCPPRSLIGAGVAEVKAPGGTVIAEPVVSVFNGPSGNQVRLHTYSENLGTGSPIVKGRIINAPGKKWGKALSVPEAPETGGVLITKFNATLFKSRSVALAKCPGKKAQRKFRFRRTVTYKDGTSETVFRVQNCKPRR